MPANTIENKCNGCHICVDICPGNVRFLDKVKKIAFVKYPEECWYCGCCQKECPNQAVFFTF